MLHFADSPPGFKAVGQWLPANLSQPLFAHLFTGRVDAFIIPTFRWCVLAAGFALAIMAAVFAFFPADAECCSASDCSHPLSRFKFGQWLTFLVLLVPISAAARYSPNSFSSSTIMNRGGIATDASTLPQQPARLASASSSAAPEMPLPTKDGTPAPATPAPAAGQPASAANDYLERTSEGYIVAEVLDLLYAAQDINLRKDFEGKTVQLVGQLMPDTTQNAKGNRFKAVRMFMTCCAADARPVAALVEADQLPTVPEMTWIKIVGTATFPIENGRRTAILKADKVEKVDPPSETMLY